MDVEDGTLSDKSDGDELVYRVVVEEEASWIDDPGRVAGTCWPPL